MSAEWNGTVCGDVDRSLTVVNSTSAPAPVDPAGGIACADTGFFVAIYGPLYGLVCVLGLVGNCLSICVLRSGRSDDV